jgi:hypothetical protein
MRLFLLSIFIFLKQVGYGQDSLPNIDIKQIPQKKIRLFIHKHILAHNSKFSDLHTQYSKDCDSSKYIKEEQRFILKEKIAKVWSAYRSFNPAEIWKGKMITFGVSFSRNTKAVAYRTTKNSGIDTGEIILLNLSLLKGTINLAVGLEVTSIDSINQFIEFCYINGDISRGIQRIQLITTADGYTQVVHTTLFKSASAFRDRYIYPFFHRKTVNEFHRNMRELVYSRQSSITAT